MAPGQAFRQNLPASSYTARMKKLLLLLVLGGLLAVAAKKLRAV